MLILFVRIVFIFIGWGLKPEYKIILIRIFQICWASLKYQIIFNSVNTILFPNWTTFWIILIIVRSIILRLARSHMTSLGKLRKILICLFILIIITLALIIVTNRMVLFYILFELSIIPIFIIILGWGYQPERHSAAYSLFFYTVRCSMPLIIIILIMSKFQSTRVFQIQAFPISVSNNLSAILSLRFILAFLVKFPIYGGHLWLPKAHVEAPVFGSIILAAILLKLAGVGVIRFSIFYSSEDLLSLVIIFSIFGILTIRLLCVKILDMKIIVAYSSVAHMSLVIARLLIQNKIAALLAMFIILTHAFRSSAAFYGVNLIYRISNSRSLIFNKGRLVLNSGLSLFWILTIIARIAAPPSINLFSEILCISLIVSFFPALIIFIIFSVVASGAYSLILYSSTQAGKTNWENTAIFKNTIIEKLILLIHRLIIYLSIFLIHRFI